MSKTKPSETFCVLPWVHQFINLGGEHQVCCTSEEYDNHICDDSGKPFMASEPQSSEVIHNSKYMRNIRQTLMKGDWPQNLPSLRNYRNNGRPQSPPEREYQI